MQVASVKQIYRDFDYSSNCSNLAYSVHSNISLNLLPLILNAKADHVELVAMISNTFNRDDIGFQKESRLVFDAKKLCHPNNYKLPLPEKITHIYQLPSLYQIVNNHFALHFNLSVMSVIKLFSIKCEFHPLFVRNDGISIVKIDKLRTEQVICEAPIHGFQGIVLETDNEFNFNNEVYIPICITRLNTDYLFTEDNERYRFNTKNIPDKLILNIDGNEWC